MLIAILGMPAPGDAVASFQGGWAFMTGAALATGVAAAAIGRTLREPSPAQAPAPASA